MTDDPVARLKAGLDADEAWFGDRRSVDDPVGEDLRQRLLRTIAAHREILDLHRPEPFYGNNPPPSRDRTPGNAVAWYCQCQCTDGAIQGTYPCETVLALAAVYGDDDT